MSDQAKSVFPSHLRFAHPWRNYQQKILVETNLLLNQRKFHLVAPPGSGKTILGLELMRRLDRKTLILAPTLVIREQWIERLIQDFGAEMGGDWISRDLHAPALLTVCTYQALHQAWKTNPQIITQLQQAGIETLIVDECHHLQKEWWKPLITLKKELEPLLIALTATPPYDVSNFEWARYHELCGEIDEIIYTPELVAAGDLCPHQDYLYLCIPSEAASLELQDFHRAVVDFTEGLQHNYRFINLLKEHPWLNQPELYAEAIYENPAYFSALLIGLEGLGKVAPVSALGIIGADESQIPPLSLDWLEVLLQNLLFKDPYFAAFLQEEPIERILKTLRRMGAIEKNKVYLKEPPQLAKQLRNSVSKLHAIGEIAKIEALNLGQDLRMVILCDYIRKELLPADELDDPNQDQLGVVPIFEALRRAFPLGLEIGILSGSLVIVPKASEELLNQVLEKWNIPIGDLRRNTLKHDPLYLHIEPVSSKAKTAIVNIITMLFARGGIQALVGTTALLGEGWDAPEINTLVLASFVGSHVLSNQMRGRAIRVHRQIVEKTANIWHLACIDPLSPDGGSDVLMLRRRMSTFFGLGQGAQPLIISGMDRFALPTLPIALPELEQFNYNTAVYAKARPRLQQVWQEAIGSGYAVQEKVRVPLQRNTVFKGKKKLALEQASKVYRSDFKRFNVFAGIWVVGALGLVAWGRFIGWDWGNLLFSTTIGILLLSALDFSQLRRLRWVPQITRYFKELESYRPRLGLRMGLYALIVGGVIWQWGFVFGLALVTFILAGWLLYLSLFSSNFILRAWSNLRRIKDPQLFWSSAAQSLFDALDQVYQFHANPEEQVHLEVDANRGEDLVLVPKNLDTHSAQLYLNALQELLNPIENPRYLLALEYRFDLQTSLLYYFPVPTCLGKKKKDAERFQDFWAEKMGPTRLIFTRTLDGRLELLKARGQSLGLSPEAYAARESSWE
ncbi:MAG: DEAD/DEAH box helicase family protein [Haliscomenobacter sp.]|uniref:DEAD/DEAH box helicase family protein n=1 Tax=Haliscomenobacter sp. TaxID=2717303 RepID=UPI0029A8212F|nr:DEAD/DEAH box helicase family protein [Haliscomenobacter sp.]MDX2071900.1 DEAD/DEAH box helicase family protein [Haliscomenobacter sp.]